jgi:hypothetical protein
MFSTLKRLFKMETAAVDMHPAAVNRMTLEQRRAYRQEMLYQSIRESFLSLEVVSSMYKFKVMPVDVRHHRFIAMIDVAKSFVSGVESRTRSFADVERGMRLNTYNRYGILITGVYWRVSDTVSEFEPQPRATDATKDAAAAAMQARKAGMHTGSGQEKSGARLARDEFHPVSEEETRAFMDALRKGVAPPPVVVGDLEYKSDMAPLDDGIMIGGTQYGSLRR